MDQIPLPFCSTNKRTLDCKGSKWVWLNQGPRSGLDKRQATLMLCIRAEGEQIVAPLLIFRGTGKRITQHEKSQYPSTIKVAWQRKAWADRVVCVNWLDDFIEVVRAETQEEVMLGMDQHGSQKVAEFQQKMANNDVFGVYTPTSCTDVVAPVDHHIGGSLKQKIGQYYDEEFGCSFEEFTSRLSDSQVRIWIARWVARAWEELKSEDAFIRKAFVHTGFLNARDGSENHLIQLHTKEQLAEEYDVDVFDEF